jgi:hypothetical protein
MASFGLVLLMLQQPEAQEITAAGWLFMGAAWAAILWATIYSFGKILRKK